MSLLDKTKPVAMMMFSGKCGGCGAKDDVLTRGGLSFRPKGTTGSVRRPEGAAEVSKGHSRTAGRSEGPNESTRGRPASFVVVGAQQLHLWDRLPGSESSGATVRQTTAAEVGPDPAAVIVMEEVVRKENLVLCRTGTLDSLRIRKLNGQIDSNRRIRTRTSGGVGGRRP